jgi:GH24 family phage-related lysozyme (muramidase)
MDETSTVTRISASKLLGRGGLEQRVANNERKITILKNIEKAKKSKIGENLDLIGVSDGIDAIRKQLEEDYKLDQKSKEKDRKKRERDARAKKEGDLEGPKLLGNLKKTAENVIKPVKNIFDRVLKFLATILFGNAMMKIIDWFSDEKNKEKVGAITGFLEKTWPALLTAFVLFGTSFGRVVSSLLGMSLRFIPKVLAATARLAIKNPLAAVAVGGIALAGGLYAANQLNQPEEEQTEQTNLSGGGFAPKGTDIVPAMLTPGEFVMSRGAVDAFGSDFMKSINAAGGGTNQPTTSYFSAGGLVKGAPEPREKDGFFGGLMKMFGGGSSPSSQPRQQTARGASASGDYDSFAKQMIKVHEGLRLDKYIDSEGYPTIGYGHLIESGEPMPDRITQQRADSLFDDDYKHHKDAASKIPGYENASGQQKAALIDLTFNMGPAWANGFPAFKRAFAAGDYNKAADELIDSQWYGQVGRRGPTIVNLIRGRGVGDASYLKGITPPPKGDPAGDLQRKSSAPPPVMPPVSPPPAVVSSSGAGYKPIMPPIRAKAGTRGIQMASVPIGGADKPVSNGTDIPSFDASAMNSSQKISILGITV